jgi:hypothetical protein
VSRRIKAVVVSDAFGYQAKSRFRNGDRVMTIQHPTVLRLPENGPGPVLQRFRTGFYACLARRADVLFELTDAIACGTAPITDLAHLSLEAEHRRGHGGLYDGLNAGVVDTGRLRALVCAGPLPKVPGPDGRERIVLAVDVSNWLRPDAARSPDRAFCHTYARGSGQAQVIPGWPYSFVCALEARATSWTALLDVVRLHPDDDATAVTAAQLRGVVEALTRAGHHLPDDPEIVVVMDAGYDVVRLAWLLDDLPVVLIGRVRSDRVFHAPAGARRGPTEGRGPRHGARLVLADPATHPGPTTATVHETARYARAEAVAFARLHPRLESRGGWNDHGGRLPLIEGTLVGLRVERLPGDRAPKPVWLWVSKPVPDDGAEVDHWWSMYLRRFDVEHTFRFLKQTLGWTRPRLRDPSAADRWTWLDLAVHTQLRLARPLAADHRLPWQRPLPAARLTPRGSAPAIAGSAGQQSIPPERQNPQEPDQDAPKDARTVSRQSSNPSGKDIKG